MTIYAACADPGGHKECTGCLRNPENRPQPTTGPWMMPNADAKGCRDAIHKPEPKR